MPKRDRVLMLCLAATLSGCAVPGLTSMRASGRYEAMLAASKAGEQRLLLKATGLDATALRALGDRHHLELLRAIPALGSAVYSASGARPADLAAMAKERGVQWLERDVAGRVFDAATPRAEGPDDPGFADQWDMQRMHVAEAWELRTGAPDTMVAVVDTGVDLTHPDLADKLVSGTNITQPGASAQDDLGHGTAVAGIIAADVGNGVGLAGVAPRALVLPVKVNVAGTGTVRASDAAAGLVWAADQGASVANLSLGFTEGEDGLTPDGLQTLKQAVSYALSKGVLVVCAAGNIDGRPVNSYPAAWAGSPGFEGLIAVGALDRKDHRAAYSNTGPWLSVVAPADDIPVLAIGGGYGRFGGTSAAAPHVSGLAALLMTPSRPPSLKTLRSWIVGTAQDLGPKGPDGEYGAGCVDALAAIQTSAR